MTSILVLLYNRNRQPEGQRRQRKTYIYIYIAQHFGSNDIYIYILLLLPHFSKRISVGSYGKSTKISALSWERTEKPKEESGQK